MDLSELSHAAGSAIRERDLSKCSTYRRTDPVLDMCRMVLSIDFVPRVSARNVPLQPNAKNAVVHLSYELGMKHWEWIISPSREGFTERIERIAGETVPRITEWLKNFNSIEDVISIERKKTGTHDFYCYPLQVLAFAFCLARVGRAQEARHEFDKVISL